jgi:hypothetical protein
MILGRKKESLSILDVFMVLFFNTILNKLKDVINLKVVFI